MEAVEPLIDSLCEDYTAIRLDLPAADKQRAPQQETSAYNLKPENGLWRGAPAERSDDIGGTPTNGGKEKNEEKGCEEGAPNDESAMRCCLTTLVVVSRVDVELLGLNELAGREQKQTHRRTAPRRPRAKAAYLPCEANV